MIYEGSIRVCCAVRWPGHIATGAVCDEMLVSMDFLPMILNAVGVAPPEDRVLDGRDPTAVLAGKASSPHESLFWRYDGSDAVRHGRYKLARDRAAPQRVVGAV